MKGESYDFSAISFFNWVGPRRYFYFMESYKMSKGSRNRTTDVRSFNTGWDRIFKKSAKERYDDKRRNDPERAKKHKAALIARRIKKDGVCCNCGKKGKTVLHHPDYDRPYYVLELCYKCHRAEHPRKMPNGKVL